MEIVSIERKTFEEMKERFGCFSQHVRELCARYRPPEKMNVTILFSALTRMFPKPTFAP